MNKPTVYAYVIPEWAICALEYDDYTGLNNDEIDMVKDFSMSLPKDGHFHFDENRYFSNYPEFGLPTTCVNVNYVIINL